MIFGMQIWIFWLILSIFFLIIEAFTVNLISIWFALGSIVALGMSLFGASIPAQIIVFFIISIVAITLFLYLKGRLNLTYKKIEKTNADRNIGRTGIVTIAVDPIQNNGQVKVGGQIWSAISEDEQRIPVGTHVTVMEIRGAKIIVREATNNKPEAHI